MTTVVACPVPWSTTVMQPRAARWTLGPGEVWILTRAHELLMGRRTFALAERLAASAHWPPDKLQGLQLGKLRRLVEHAVAHCPYYRERDLPRGPTLRDLAALSAFPLLTRDDLRREAWRICWQNMPGRRLIDHSRGTTEDRLAYYWDRRRQAWDKANRLRGQAWHGFSIDDRELHLWPLDPPKTLSAALKQWLRSERDRLLGELQIDCLHAFSDRLAVTWRNWRRFDPARVTAYPSALAQLIRDGRWAGCRVGNPALQKVFLTGEVAFDWQRRLIEAELGVPTAQMYGVQEAGALAFACEHGSWHVSAESAIVELIRDGQPARPGELAEVVVTGLESLAMPVIRYCTGDIVRAAPRQEPLALAGGLPEGASPARRDGRRVVSEIPHGQPWHPPSAVQTGRANPDEVPTGYSPGPCPCGQGLPVMPPVLGRAGDFLATDDGRWVEPAAVVARLGEVLENGTFQVSQDRYGGVDVRVVSSARLRPGWSNAARAIVREIVGPKTRCAVREVPALHRSLFGKCRYVSSEVTRQGLAGSPRVDIESATAYA